MASPRMEPFGERNKRHLNYLTEKSTTIFPYRPITKPSSKIMMRVLILFTFLIHCFSSSQAQSSAQQIKNTPHTTQNDGWDLNKWIWSQTNYKTGKNDKPVLDFNAIDNWVSLGNDQDLSISSDGKYFAYTIRNQPYQSSTLVIQSTTGSWKQSFVAATAGFFAGEGQEYIFQNGEDLYFLPMGGEPKIVKEAISYKQPENSKGKWLAYQQKNASNVVLKSLTNGNEQCFDGVAVFDFDKSGEWLACQLANELKELLIYNLNTGRTQRFQSVMGYSFSDNGQVLILKTMDQSLQYVRPQDGKSITFWSADKGTKITSFSTDTAGKQVMFIVNEGSNSKQPENCIWYWRPGMDKASMRVNNQTTGIDPGLFIQSANLVENGRYFSITLQERPDVRQLSPEGVKIDVWSYKDTTIQSTQSHQKQPKTYFAVIGSESGRVIPLERQFEKLKIMKGDFAVIAKTGKEVNGDRFWEKDYKVDSNWLVFFKDGTRMLLKTTGNENQTTFWFSPDGQYLVYFDLEDECHYFSYNLTTGKLVKISAGIPSWQLGIGNEYLGPNKPTGKAGIMAWLPKENGLFVYDLYDIWRLDLAAKKPPVNITAGYGRSHHVQFRLAASSIFEGDHNAPLLGDKDTLLLKATHMVSKYNGFYRKVLETSGDPEILYMGPCVLAMSIPSDHDWGMQPLKATRTNTWIVKRQTAIEAPNYFLTTDFKNYTNLTDLQPQKQYNWFTSELHRFKQLDGTMSQGILYTPENFDPTKKYPVIIGFYEQFSQQLYQYLEPGYVVSPYIEIPWLVSHGYLVFTPDIYFALDKWGASALNTVDGAAKYLSNLTYVDGKGMGATGHSNSGRYGYYVLTHSHYFAAMSVGAGVTNITSIGLSIDERNGESALGWAEVPRGTTGLGNLWKNKSNWLDHTAVFHADNVSSPLLMFHCKKDWAPVQAAIEMFIALRRLEKRVWWLQYDEGNHTVSSWSEMKDFTIRTTQFYDHYLKEAPPPRWMTEGIPNKLKGIEARYELDPKGSCGRNCKVCKKVTATINGKINPTP
jgi:hypothetical protein